MKETFVDKSHLTSTNDYLMEQHKLEGNAILFTAYFITLFY